MSSVIYAKGLHGSGNWTSPCSKVGMTCRRLLSVLIRGQPSQIDWFILAIMCIRLKVELAVTRRSLIICREPTAAESSSSEEKQHKSPEISHGAGGLHGPRIENQLRWEWKIAPTTAQRETGAGAGAAQDLWSGNAMACGLFTMSLDLDKGISLFWFGFNFEQRIN